MGTMVLAFVVPFEKVWRRNRVLLFGPLIALLVWAAIVAETKKDGFTFEGSGQGAGEGYALVLLAAFLVLSTAPTQMIQRFLALSSILVAVLALAQYAGLLSAMFPVFVEYNQRMYSVFGNQDLMGSYLAVGLVLGFALWLAGQAGAIFVSGLFVTTAPALLLSGSRSAWLAAAVGGAFAAGQSSRSRGKLVKAAAAMIVTCVVAVFIAPGSTWHRFAGSFAPSDAGYRIRLWIWDGTIHLIRQHPIAGVGLGNFAFHSPRALGEILHQRGPGVHVFNHIHTLHAHSDLLEVAAESGLIGVTFLLVFFLLIPRRYSPAWPALAAAFTFSLINTSLHSAPHILAIILLAGSLISYAGPTIGGKIGSIERRFYHVAMGFLVAMFGIFPLWPSALHARALAVYEARGNAAEGEFVRAAYSGGNRSAAYELAVLEANTGQEETAMSAAEYASQGLDTGDLYYLRAYLAERRGRKLEAATFYRECVLRWPDDLRSYAGLLRNTGLGEREAILNEAQRWLTANDYAALTSTSPTPAR